MLKAAFVLLACTALARAAAPIIEIRIDAKQPAITHLSWDTEGGERAARNLLRGNAMVGLRVRTTTADAPWQNAVDLPTSTDADNAQRHATYHIAIPGGGELVWSVAQSDASHLSLSIDNRSPNLDAVEIHFPFDPQVTPTTILADQWSPEGRTELPAIVTAPDFGQMLLTVRQGPSPVAATQRAAQGVPVTLRLEGDRGAHQTLLVVQIPQGAATQGLTLDFSPVVLDKPRALRDELNLWPGVRRGWFNAFQPTARWGDPNRPLSSPPGLLANNVISDPASLSLWFYADQAFFTPNLAPGVSAMSSVGRTVEFWLTKRMDPTGEIVGYWSYRNFLDANPSVLISAWDYVEATGDTPWLRRFLPMLEKAADFLLSRDVDHDGLLEATQPGAPNALQQPNRSCAWWDALNCGHKDSYTNALAYRALRCLADLEQKLGRSAEREKYNDQADQLQANYFKTLYNEKTGLLAWWKDRDGALHDYAAPTINGLAIEYGLVPPEQSKAILHRLRALMKERHFTRQDLGLPGQLTPVAPSDYLAPDAIGRPARPDGTDTFGHYMNGGISPGHTLHFLAACYRVDEPQLADDILVAMVARQAEGKFQNGVRDAANQGIDWTDWNGNPTGYEGYLADSFRFLQATLLREQPFRARLYRPLTPAHQQR